MTQYYSDYYWKNGKPKGIREEEKPLSFRIVTDPYHKRYTVEKYGEKFEKIVYDSSLLDFRKLTPQHQTAWVRENLEDREDYQKCLIRDMDDRVILLEHLYFHHGKCRKCEIFSPHGLHLATQKICFEEQGNPFSGVILYDSIEKVVMVKKYSLGENGEFEEVLEECWDTTRMALIEPLA